MSETEKDFSCTVFLVDGKKVDANGEPVKASKADDTDAETTDSKPAKK